MSAQLPELHEAGVSSSRTGVPVDCPRLLLVLKAGESDSKLAGGVMEMSGG